MRPKYLVIIFVLLALAVPASPAQAGGIVSVCDQAHLLAALAGGGTVTFSCSGTITLSGYIIIAADTRIDGSGQAVTITGSNAVQVFRVNSGVTLNLNELTVAYGHGSNGGGIYNLGTLTVSNSTFFGNTADQGGGIFNYGTLTVSNSTFSGNSAGFGGGIYNTGGTVNVSNSTFSGNQSAVGAAISNAYFPGTLTVSKSTFAGNLGTGGGGGVIVNWGGTHPSTATLENTIVANSLDINCNGTFTDGGGNLSYPDTTCPGVNSNPLLGPLQNNGGPTRTMALGPGSAALDAANYATCAAAPVNNLDQRGVTRPAGVAL